MVALFDMDGTLFPGDSQLRFARWILRRHGWRRLYLLLVVPCGLLRALQIIGTPLMKRAMLSYAWGMKRSALERECVEFVRQEILPALYPEVKECLHRHQERGDTTVLCSASPDWWTRHVGKALGFTHTIGTPLRLGGSERIPLFPRIPLPGNNKGANKLIRLENIGITHADIGYTDSAADTPLLSICDSTVLINPKASFAAKHPNALVLTPHKGIGRVSFILSCLFGM